MHMQIHCTCRPNDPISNANSYNNYSWKFTFLPGSLMNYATIIVSNITTVIVAILLIK